VSGRDRGGCDAVRLAAADGQDDGGLTLGVGRRRQVHERLVSAPLGCAEPWVGGDVRGRVGEWAVQRWPWEGQQGGEWERWVRVGPAGIGVRWAVGGDGAAVRISRLTEPPTGSIVAPLGLFGQQKLAMSRSGVSARRSPAGAAMRTSSRSSGRISSSRELAPTWA